MQSHYICPPASGSRYVDEFDTEVVQAAEDSYVDTESLNTENEMQADSMQQGNPDPLAGGQI
jgi:hypothetical protein